MAEIITKDCKEYHIWDKVNGVWNRLFFKTNAKSVEADDGKELQTKVGAINGISSSSTATDENIAASIGYVNQELTELNTNLQWYIDNGYLPDKNAPISLIPKMTSNTEPYGVASASADFGDGYRPYMAFNDSNDSAWQVMGTGWIQYEFRKNVIIHYIKYRSFPSYDHETPLDAQVILQVSNDGTTWNDVKTINILASQQYDLVTVTLDSPVECKYVRFSFSSANQKYSTYTYCILSILQCYGYHTA